MFWHLNMNRYGSNLYTTETNSKVTVVSRVQLLNQEEMGILRN
jgi:hypothetical protein